MPGLAPEMHKTDSSSQLPAESAQLPSFYSPPTEAAADVGDSHENITDLRLSSTSASTSAIGHTHTDNNNTNNNSTNASLKPFALSSHLSQPPPPPSLLSPAFTPPAPPGTATPTTPSASQPRGVPVDSSDPTSGGCGSTRPKLLETLPHVECIVRARIPTTGGAEMFLHLYTNDVDNKEHLAIVFGNDIRSRSLDAPRPGETEMDRLVRGAYTGRLFPGRTTSRVPGGESPAGQDEGREGGAERQQPPLVRIHSECYTGETVWSARCDCGEQLDEAARLMSLGGGGIIIYLRQEGRGIGLGEKLKAYNLQDLGSDTVEANLLLRHPADARSYGLATAMLLDLGQREIRLLTNNPDKIRAVEGPNREVVVRERVAMIPLSWKGKGGFRAPEVEGYLKTKIEKMGHMLEMASMPST
ncbi:GTP cyclohydrolase II [Coniochaeta ligniaria NRRL 30616]|uniref:GTP cyclohydrolase II n=1 Tax=Coniochaeta ligniaria NRRL 30616 TaxID=1408157 RepID=A0A1J7J316_9PEZI|nr:GTP cyclohydrolase II [Coniochaeta ligniaria NRRL 30616]